MLNRTPATGRPTTQLPHHRHCCHTRCYDPQMSAALDWLAVALEAYEPAGRRRRATRRALAMIEQEGDGRGMTSAELVAQLDGVKRQGAGWIARCPAHEDRHQSLKIDDRDGNSWPTAMPDAPLSRSLRPSIRASPLRGRTGTLARRDSGASPFTRRYEYLAADGTLAYYVERHAGQAVPDSTARTARKIGDRRSVSRTDLPELHRFDRRA